MARAGSSTGVTIVGRRSLFALRGGLPAEEDQIATSERRMATSMTPKNMACRAVILVTRRFLAQIRTIAGTNGTYREVQVPKYPVRSLRNPYAKHAKSIIINNLS
jgi:hypothetical protein